LHLAAAKFSLDAHKEWARYLAYKGLPVTSSDEELTAFLNRGPEAVCRAGRYHRAPPGPGTRAGRRVDIGISVKVR
jgi:hypothetical protein